MVFEITAFLLDWGSYEVEIPSTQIRIFCDSWIVQGDDSCFDTIIFIKDNFTVAEFTTSCDYKISIVLNCSAGGLFV